MEVGIVEPLAISILILVIIMIVISIIQFFLIKEYFGDILEGDNITQNHIRMIDHKMQCKHQSED
ncbi:MAG: hypothetical protein KAQ99_08585 [Candidatus Aureabacteria bacterium]|nr:hypothetical protein [Candidatus Auribacterota bacterium]